MRPFSVIIPTASEPVLLRTALESVSRQTALCDVETVFVSENLRDRRSMDVCDEFSALPIEYIIQDPPLTPTQNYEYLLRRCSTDLIAFLCDDDWWGTGHLEAGACALEVNRDAVASFSASFFVSGEAPMRGSLYLPAALWVASGMPGMVQNWLLSPEQLLAVTWLLTPFHLSSMIVRRSEATARISDLLSTFHHYQADRAYYVQLAGAGSVVFDPLPDTFVRWRPDNATLRTPGVEREAAFRQCTKFAWEASVRHGLDVAGIWRQSLEGVDGDLVDEIGASFRRAMDRETLKVHGFDRFESPSLLGRLMRRATRFAKGMVGMALDVAAPGGSG